MFGGLGFFEAPRPFKTQYRCYSVSMMPGNERLSLEQGGKIILPPSALDQLTRLNIVYPMLFKLTNSAASRTTHCGVLEFVADEGKVYIPYWMMQNLALDEGEFITVESASLPVATHAKFQPHSVDFLDLTNPKAVLEARLRNFACLSAGDVIAIMYNDKTYEMSVLETKPAPAVSVIECDLNVDFAPPVGYEDPSTKAKKGQGQQKGSGGGKATDSPLHDLEEPMDVSHLLPEQEGFIAFGGSGNRLDGKKKKSSNSFSESAMSASPNAKADADSDVAQRPKVKYVRGIPDYDYEIGILKFIRAAKPKLNGENGGADDADEKKDNFEAFKGQGHSLKQKGRK